MQYQSAPRKYLTRYVKVSIKINLWFSEHSSEWRWTLLDDKDSITKMESGSQKDLRVAMNDVANTVEYLIKESIDK